MPDLLIESTNATPSDNTRTIRRILLVVHTSVWGGAEVFLRNLAIELAGLGHKVVIAVDPDPAIAGRFASVAGALLIPWSPGISAGRWRGLGAAVSYLPWTKSRFRDLLVLARDMHGCDSVLFQYPDEQTIGTAIARALGYHVAWLFHSKPYRALHRLLVVPALCRAAQSVSVIFSISHATQRALENLGLPRDKLMPLHVGLTEAHKPQPTAKVKGLIAVVSRLEWNKGVQDILAAMPTVLSSLPEARLEIAGEGRSRAPLERLSRRLGISSRVDFLGFIDPAPLYARAVCIAHATFDPGDSMPTNLLEAARAGVPAIATRWNGIPEIVKHGVTGLLTPPRDVAAFGAALESMLRFPDVATRMGVAAYERSLDFTMAGVAESILQGIAANPPRPVFTGAATLNEISLFRCGGGHD